MTFNVDILVRELNGLLELVAGAGTAGRSLTDRQKIGGLEISTSISVKVGLLESLGPNPNDLAGKDPIVDVFEDDKNIKLVALIPGIQKEDIETNMRDGFIEVKIRKGYSMFYRSIPCDVRPDDVSVKSVAYNNSVLEIVFNKGGI